MVLALDINKNTCYLDRQMNVKIAEIAKQQKQLEVFFTTNINLVTFE